LGEPAAVTFSVSSGDAKLDGSVTWGAVGDINRRVEPGAAKSFTWQPRVNYPNAAAEAGSLKIELKAWAVTSPPDYMAVDLDTALTNAVYYYADEASVPGGVQDRRYKTNYLLMRRIYAAGIPWIRGRNASEANWQWGDTSTAKYEVAAKTKLTSDYYIGVYEFTQFQWAALGGGWPSAFQGDAYPDYEMYPVSSLRVGWNESADPVTPVRNQVAKINGATGLGLDLPTEAQWEYACRAGSPYPYCFDAADPTSAQVGEYAWHSGNSAVDGVMRPHVVGTRRANRWGLYDMHGNINEFCLDYWKVSTQDLTEEDPFRDEPADSAAGLNGVTLYPRVHRGGDYRSSWSQNCRSSWRYDSLIRSEWWPGAKEHGFRLVCPATAPKVD
jgi:formylglycine-generating enzyme required for sulfatase activity